MEKSINLKINLKQQSSVLSKVHYFHEEEVKKDREYLQIIVETLIFTAVQNNPQGNNAEDRDLMLTKYQTQTVVTFWSCFI